MWKKFKAEMPAVVEPARWQEIKRHYLSFEIQLSSWNAAFVLSLAESFHLIVEALINELVVSCFSALCQICAV
jgi:hypothetical protein